MRRDNFNDLLAFITVASEGSFTRAAARLGVSQSAISHTVRALEERLGVRLLARTTRSVAPTAAGERLLEQTAPRLAEVQQALDAMSELRERPAGRVRITASGHATHHVLWPKLQPLLRQHPDIQLELSADYALTDIVAERFDAGVRFGDLVEKDMVALRIGPDVRVLVCASPLYLARHGRPGHPRELPQHNCINLRLPTLGNNLVWEFEQAGQPVKVRVDGQLTFNTSAPILDAALAGFGLCWLPEDMVLPLIQRGELECVLEDWCPRWPGYHLYYPSRRQHSPAFQCVIDALRHHQP